MSPSAGPTVAFEPIGERDAVRRQSDVVEHRAADRAPGSTLAHRLLDLREQQLGLLEPRARRRAHVQLELPAVHRAGRSPRRSPAPAAATASDEHAAPMPARRGDAPSRRRASRDTPPRNRSNAAIERGDDRAGTALGAARRVAACACCASRPAACSRPSSARACATGSTTPPSRRSPRAPAAGTAPPPVRTARRSAGRRCRSTASRRTPEWRSAARRRRSRRRSGFPVLDVAVDVLDRHRRVVDEDADGEREPAQRHHVERLAHRPQRR